MKILADRIKWLVRVGRDLLLTPVVVLMPRNRRKIVFGAWSGHQYSCNPRYLFEALCLSGKFTCVWIGDIALRDVVLSSVPGARFAAKGSLSALWHCLTARFYACNVQWRSDIIDIPRCNRVVLLYLTHGMPDKKGYGGDGAVQGDTTRRTGLRLFLSDALSRLFQWQYRESAWCSHSSRQSAGFRIQNCARRFSWEKSLCEGTPRGDFFRKASSNNEQRNELRQKFAKLLGLDLSRKWWLFVPTWRHESKYLFSFSTSKKFAEYVKLFKANDVILLEKQHPKTLEDGMLTSGSIGPVKVISKDEARQIDTQELLVACDRLITDYSSVYYDFVLMNRPVIHFTYDFDHFMDKDMGFLYDIRDYGGGPFAYSEDELLDFLKRDDSELLMDRSPETLDVQLAGETGHACEAYGELLDRLSKINSFFVR